MKDKRELFLLIETLDGAPFEECRALLGDFDFNRYTVKFTDMPHATDEQAVTFIVRVPQSIAAFPEAYYTLPIKRLALEDLLLRKMVRQLQAWACFDAAGVARRRVHAPAPGQKILPRTAVVINEDYVEGRLLLDLPFENGKLLGAPLKNLFFEELPLLINRTMLYCNLDPMEVEETVNLMVDGTHVRQLLPTRGLVGFLANGSLLARVPGSDEPDYSRATPFEVPPEERITIETPTAGKLEGLGIPTGITVVVGEEYQGRRELIQAVAAGIYNHVGGDGRELVITVPDAVHVRTDSGRSIQQVDLSLFLENGALTGRKGPFSTAMADGFVSQAASTLEAIEAGARVLIFDEAESSPAFLASDGLLERLGKEGTIRPLSMQARRMADELGLSMIIGVSALASEFVGIADTVLHVEESTVRNVTSQVAGKPDDQDPREKARGEPSPWLPADRVVVPSSIDPSLNLKDAVIEAPSPDLLAFGRCRVDLSSLPQLADKHQTATVGLILYYAKLRYMDEKPSLRKLLDWIDRDLSSEGLAILSRNLRGDLARPRRYEIAAVLNRLPSLRMTSARVD